MTPAAGRPSGVREAACRGCRPAAGEISGIALDLQAKDGSRFPVLTSSLATADRAGKPQLIRTIVFDGRERRAYEQELLHARQGVEAAAVTALARYTLRAAAVYDPDPAAVLHNLNRVLYQEYRRDARYCTVVFGILTLRPDGFHAVIASGGHPEPLVLRGDGTADYHRTKGRLVGVFPGSVYANTEVTLHPGDTLVLYTDGVTEARARAGTNAGPRFGVDAVARFANDLAPGGAQMVIDAFVELLDAFGTGLDDDTAVMAIGVPINPSSRSR